MCGVKIGLFFPLNTLATSDAKRPLKSQDLSTRQYLFY